MAQKRIIDLDQTDNVEDLDEFVLDNGIQTLKCTSEQIKEYVLGDLPNAVATLHTNLVLTMSRVNTLEQNYISKAFLKDTIKTGRFSYNSDNNYQVFFDEPFVEGTDADIQVLLQRHGGNLQSAQGVTNLTKGGFWTDRENGIDGEQTYSYVAINLARLSSL